MLPSVHEIVARVGEDGINPTTLLSELQLDCTYEEAIEGVQRAIEQDHITLNGEGYVVLGSYQWA